MYLTAEAWEGREDLSRRARCAFGAAKLQNIKYHASAEEGVFFEF